MDAMLARREWLFEKPKWRRHCSICLGMKPHKAF